VKYSRTFNLSILKFIQTTGPSPFTIHHHPNNLPPITIAYQQHSPQGPMAESLSQPYLFENLRGNVNTRHAESIGEQLAWGYLCRRRIRENKPSPGKFN
jgi:hypothetical protein